MITLTVPGRPVPAQRMTQKTKWTERAQRSLAYQQLVATAALTIRPRPLSWKFVGVDITVYLSDRGGLPGVRGDWDNYGKAICDGLQHARVVANDKCIIDGAVHVRPCSSPAEERAEVILREVFL